ncbi:hypothetical protein VHEMI05231 [[Torrubiella] hemipterigena]|uniref:Fungal-type protein kinase domain-containing protein n=1 Tax=[Torrubiella] hemipterigena TaxID=1531966 RepID=A0A0A1TI69_9HYPO|nr:hypothetical protein VHEMI05231 [[Torrubiella] hemipterigena]
MASHVLRSQPLRLSVHAVLVHRLVFEAWVFDKSGMYVSEPLGLMQDRATVLLILLQYSQKSRENLGWRSLERNEQNQAYVTVRDTKTQYFLENMPFVQRGELFNDGLACYRASSAPGQSPYHVVKFKWCIPRLQKEPHMLYKAKEKMIKGVISLV